MSPEQIRAGRNWLGWSQQELADRCDLAVSTISNIEKGGSQWTHPATIPVIRAALGAAGIFAIENGVMFDRPQS